MTPSPSRILLLAVLTAATLTACRGVGDADPATPILAPGLSTTVPELPDTSIPSTPTTIRPAGGSVAHRWVRTNPGGGGAIAVVGATASGMMLAASDLSGVYRSTDMGASWEPLGAAQGLVQTHTSALGFHPTDGDTFFVGTGWGVFKTTDGGDHFTQVHPDGYIESIVIAPSDPAVGYMAYHEDWDTPGEVFATIDGGDSWHAVPGEDLPDDIRITKVVVHPADAKVVYALGGKTRWGCSEAALFRSSDGGVHWVRIGGSFPAILDVDVDPTDPATVLAATFEANPCAPNQNVDDYLGGDENSGALFRSTDAGVTWTRILDHTGIISVGDDPSVIRLVDMLFPYDWNEGAGTWLTEDGGGTWRHVGFVADWDTGWATNQYFAFAPSFNGLNKTVTRDLFDPTRFYASFGQWAWASFDGGVTLNNVSTREVSPGHWRSTGLENINGHTLAVSASNPDVLYLGGYDIGLWASVDRGSSWKRTIPDADRYPKYVWDDGQGANVTALLADPVRDGVVWAVFHKEGFGNGAEAEPGTNSALFKTTDFGDHWELSNGGLPDASMFYGLSLDPSSPEDARTLFLTVSGDVYRSTDDGADWTMILANGGLKFTAIDSADPQLVYAGGENGLWRSRDGGASWAEVGLEEMRGPIVGNFLPTEDGWRGVFQIVADPTVSGRVYVAVFGEGRGLYRSDDAGDTWAKLYDNPFLRGVAVAPWDSDVLYAGSSNAYFSGGYDERSTGIVYSRDGGATWHSAAEGMAWPFGGRIVIAPGDDPYVVAWSPGTGVQMADIPFPIGP